MTHRRLFAWRLLITASSILTLGLIAAHSHAQPAATPKTPTAAPSGSTPASAVKRGGIVRLINGAPRTLDPAGIGCARSESQSAFSYVFDSLVGYPSGPGADPLSQQIVGYLAESWEAIDAKTYRFKLKQGVKFANVAPVSGRELTSEDVKFSLDRYAAGKECAPETQHIQSIETPDKYTVLIHLKEDFAPFLNQLAGSQAWILPKEAGVADPAGVGGLSFNNPKAFIGSGPFILVSLDRTSQLVKLKRNPDFYQAGKPYVDGIETRYIADYATQVGLLRTGQIDHLTLNPGTQDEIKRTNPKLVFRNTLRKTSSAYRLALWKPPFDDIRVRRAVALAYNQDEFIQAYGGGGGRRCGFIGPNQPDWMLPCDQLPANAGRWWEDKADDVELAKKLLAEAGYPDGFTTNINLSNLASLQSRYLVDLFAAQLSRVGIQATIERVEHATHLRGYLKTDWKGITVTSTGDETVLNYFQITQPDFVYNVNRLNDPFLNQKFKEFIATTDPDQQKKLIAEVSTKMASEIYLLYLPAEPHFLAWQPHLKDFAPAVGDHDGRAYINAWLDK